MIPDTYPATARVDGRVFAAPAGRELVLRARRVLTMVPGERPVEDAAVVVGTGPAGAGIIARVERFSEAGRAHAHVVDLGEITLCPGLVNAHNHLELAHVNGPPRGAGFPAWVRWLLSQPLAASDDNAVAAAAKAMLASGTVHAADIATRTPELVASGGRAAGLSLTLFTEFFGCWGAAKGELSWPDGEPVSQDGVRRAAAGHALYSTNPETLALAKQFDAARGLPFSIHLSEHEGETELLATGTGEFAQLMSKRVLPQDYTPPGLSPAAYAERLGLLGPDSLAVHCVHMDARDLGILRKTRTNVCLCPRSNALIGVGRPPLEAYFDGNYNVCLGTDSLASNDDLDLWNEARFLRESMAAPPPDARLIRAMTQDAAKALLLDESFGTVAPGRVAAFAGLPPDFSA